MPLVDAPAQHQREKKRTTESIFVPRRVLIVDDNDDARDLTAAVLAARGHDVIAAQDGPSGLALLADRLPDVALVDIGLPGFDGFELARLFRERYPDATTRLVAITGYGQRSDRERSRLAGFDGHLVKPVPTSQILKTIATVCAEPRTRSGQVRVV